MTANKRTWKLESVLLFYLCVPVSSTLKDVCLFCRSEEKPVIKHSLCLRVVCVGGGRKELRGCLEGGCVRTCAKVNVVTGGYSILSC